MTSFNSLECVTSLGHSRRCSVCGIIIDVVTWMHDNGDLNWNEHENADNVIYGLRLMSGQLIK